MMMTCDVGHPHGDYQLKSPQIEELQQCSYSPYLIGRKQRQTKMFRTPLEALQHAPPLSFAMNPVKPSPVRETEVVTVDNNPMFNVKPAEHWFHDAAFSMGTSYVARENSCGRCMAVDNKVAVSLPMAEEHQCVFAPWASLPAVLGTVQCMCIDPCEHGVLVSVGTDCGLEIFQCENDGSMTKVEEHTRVEEGTSIRFVECLADSIGSLIVCVDEFGQISAWKVSRGEVLRVGQSFAQSSLQKLTDRNWWRSWTQPQQFRHAALDRERRHLLVLTAATLAVWSPEHGVRGTLQIKGDVVGVLPSHAQDPFLGTLVLRSGHRQQVHSTALTHGAISMRSGIEVPLDPKVTASIGKVSLCASSRHTTIMHDSTNNTLLIENANFPLFPNHHGACDIMSLIRLTEPVVGLTVIHSLDSKAWESAFIVHGRQGSIMTVLVRTVSHVLGAMVSSAGSEVVAPFVDVLGENTIADYLMAAHQLAIDPRHTLHRLDPTRIAASLSTFAQPTISPDGRSISFSPVVLSVRRRYMKVSQRAMYALTHCDGDMVELQHIVDDISQAQLNTEKVLAPGGWLDTTHSPATLATSIRWSDLGASIEGPNMATPSSAAAVQAVLLEELSGITAFFKSICSELMASSRANASVSMPTQSKLSAAMWDPLERSALLLSTGIELVTTAVNVEALRDLEVLLEIPEVVRALASLRLECECPSPTPRLFRIVETHAVKFHANGMMPHIMGMVRRLGQAAVLQCIALWAPHDVTGDADHQLTSVLEDVSDVNQFSSVAHFAFAASPHHTVDWVVAHDPQDDRREILVQLLASVTAKSPSCTAKLMSTAKGTFWYALTMLQGGSREKKEAKQLLLELAQSKPSSLALSDRLLALQFAQSIEEHHAHGVHPSELIQLCELQQRLLQGVKESNADGALRESLESQLHSEEALYHIALQCGQVVRCSAEVQLALILRHDDLPSYSAAICTALETELKWLISPSSGLVESLCLLAARYIPRISQELFPMSRFLVLMFTQHGSRLRDEFDDFCNAVDSIEGLDRVPLFMALGDLLITAEQRPALPSEWGINDVLAALVRLLQSHKFSAEERAKCLEIVSSHVALICSQAQPEEEVDVQYATIVDALRELAGTYPSTELLASQVMSALRDAGLF